MTEILSPFVFWAQTEHKLSLKVDLKDVKEPKIALTINRLEFSAVGKGARGLHKYDFVIHLFSKVDPEVCIFFKK